eukprot:CAMPEP_0115596724 /NCGR_PEP_ID=MMETSP0272-20121206/12984_1 /TAXON_ID=71861 /ORGANISM="Scrippsiella trochoidea, Strain CCMP3099" /LENGTH=146 /DNA_ID=CAMNT_0003032073 /DNA_START=80 /DNA_END=519 /DNA_ORIENTATION=-
MRWARRRFRDAAAAATAAAAVRLVYSQQQPGQGSQGVTLEPMAAPAAKSKALHASWGAVGFPVLHRSTLHLTSLGGCAFLAFPCEAAELNHTLDLSTVQAATAAATAAAAVRLVCPQQQLGQGSQGVTFEPMTATAAKSQALHASW